jgi:predicted ATP-grasp superfamily ATP-dependent carboligase
MRRTVAPPERVLVLDAQARNALAVVRSLGRRGLAVTAAEDTRFAPAMWSRWTSGRFVYPSPAEHPDEFAAALLRHVEEVGYSAVYPISNLTVRPVAARYADFQRVTRLGIPPPAILDLGMDKRATIRAARAAGTPHPRTYLVGEDGPLEEAFRAIGFPLVLKPAVGFGSRGLSIVTTEADARAAYAAAVAAHGPMLIQEFIPLRDEIGVYTIVARPGELAAVTVHRRIRSYPVSGGPSTLRETIRHPAAVELARVLLERLGWWGVAMVEFRVDDRDGVPKLMEVNPRFWGSLQLSILAGVDFPWLLHRLVTTGRVDPVPDYRVGVKCRWLVPGDILHYLSAPGKLRNLPGFLNLFAKDTGHDTFSFRDPVPFLALLATIARFSVSRKMWSFVLRNPGAPVASGPKGEAS